MPSNRLKINVFFSILFVGGIFNTSFAYEADLIFGKNCTFESTFILQKTVLSHQGQRTFAAKFPIWSEGDKLPESLSIHVIGREPYVREGDIIALADLESVPIVYGDTGLTEWKEETYDHGGRGAFDFASRHVHTWKMTASSPEDELAYQILFVRKKAYDANGGKPQPKNGPRPSIESMIDSIAYNPQRCTIQLVYR